MITLQKFIYSIGIRHIGIENSKLISDNLKVLKVYRNNKNKNFERSLNIDGIGETHKLIKNFSQVKRILICFKLIHILNIEEEKINKTGVLKNKNFMFTGKLNGISRAEAKSMIEKNSGNIISSINKKLNYLVVGEKPTKRKLDQAKNLGISIISQDQFKKLLN